jgi:hypothetical protein
MLSHSEKETILADFPNVKLSYENIIYKKVSSSDFMVAIPKGTKCFAWFSSYGNKNVCFIMELTTNKQISDIKIFNACFSNDLAFGTIFYGTLFYTSGNRFFTIEDIFSYKGTPLNSVNWYDKLLILKQIFKKDLRQVSFNNSYIVFGLPVICRSSVELEQKISGLNYPIESIRFHLLNKVNSFLSISYNDYIKDTNNTNNTNNTKINNKNNTKPSNKDITKPTISTEHMIVEKTTSINKKYVFIVKPDVQDDIYHLYSLNIDNTEKICGTAHIPSFDTSVMMNKLFRVIKENENLDALEESDDEEEFENEDIDKFVKLDTSYKMLCQYNYKFKKWVPIRVVSDNSTIISTNEFNSLSKIYEKNKNIKLNKAC